MNNENLKIIKNHKKNQLLYHFKVFLKEKAEGMGNMVELMLMRMFKEKIMVENGRKNKNLKIF